MGFGKEPKQSSKERERQSDVAAQDAVVVEMEGQHASLNKETAGGHQSGENGNQDFTLPLDYLKPSLTGLDVSLGVNGSSRGRRKGDRKSFHIKMFKTPKEISGAVTMGGIKKSEYTMPRTLGLAILSGVYLSFGSMLSSIVGGGVPTLAENNPGLQKFLFGAVFPFGLAIIILYGTELFTSNTMTMIPPLMTRQVGLLALAKNWSLSYAGNFIGSLLAAYFLSYLPQVFRDEPWKTFVTALAEKKVSMDWGEVFMRGVGCNYLVNLAVFSATAAEDVVSKYIAIWFPITAFVAIGYEHSIANMFFIPNGMMYGADVSIGDFLWKNLIPVSLGNLVSGAIFMGGVTYFAYQR